MAMHKDSANLGSKLRLRLNVGTTPPPNMGTFLAIVKWKERVAFLTTIPRSFLHIFNSA
jgi:hypothetical protein